MRPSTIVLAAGLMTAPLALLISPDKAPATSGLQQFAQATSPKVFEPAPVPSVGDPRVSPANRAGQAGDAGPAGSTPFSDVPSTAGGRTSSQSTNADGALTSTDRGLTTPALGK